MGLPDRRQALRAIWLRGYLPAILVLLLSIPSFRFIGGWQARTTPVGQPIVKWPVTVFVGYGSVVAAWGPVTNSKPGEQSLGSFMEDGFTFADTHDWNAMWLRPRWLGGQVFVPLWLLACIVALPAAAAPIWRRFRPKPWQCPACRYDRRGLAPGVPCPECGRTPPPPPTPAA
jgi:hypothetical protein